MHYVPRQSTIILWDLSLYPRTILFQISPCFAHGLDSSISSSSSEFSAHQHVVRVTPSIQATTSTTEHGASRNSKQFTDPKIADFQGNAAHLRSACDGFTACFSIIPVCPTYSRDYYLCPLVSQITAEIVTRVCNMEWRREVPVKGHVSHREV